MADQKYTADPAVTTLSGSEEMPIAQSATDKKITITFLVNYIKSIITSFYVGVSNRITIDTITGIIDIAATYIGQTSITKVGTINDGTWSGKFAPRVNIVPTGTPISTNTDNFDCTVITALNTNTTLSLTGTPSKNQEFYFRILDDGTPRTLAFGSNIRFQNITAPATTTANQTVYLVFKWNNDDSKWDCIINTDSAASISNNSVTNAKLAQMATLTIKGNNTGGTANASDLTATQVTAMLNPFTTALKGLVPSSAGATSKFLKGDATWSALPNPTFTTVEVDLGSAKRSGKFTITDSGLTVGKQVMIYQATGPYTGKGTLADESQMDSIIAQGVVTTTTNIDVYWNSQTLVRGNFKFNYLISA